MSAEIIDLAAYRRGRVEPAPLLMVPPWFGWRVGWTFQVWPCVGFVPVWVLDW